MNNCLKCGKEIPDKRKFCCLSCSTSYNNKKKERRIRLNNCLHCGKEIKGSKRELAATLYSYALRQLKYPNTNKILIIIKLIIIVAIDVIIVLDK